MEDEQRHPITTLFFLWPQFLPFHSLLTSFQTGALSLINYLLLFPIFLPFFPSFLSTLFLYSLSSVLPLIDVFLFISFINSDSFCQFTHSLFLYFFSLPSLLSYSSSLYFPSRFSLPLSSSSLIHFPLSFSFITFYYSSCFSSFLLSSHILFLASTHFLLSPILYRSLFSLLSFPNNSFSSLLFFSICHFPLFHFPHLHVFLSFLTQS